MRQYPCVPVHGSLNLVVHYIQGIFVVYRYYDRHQLKPQFPFGNGFSSTTFRFKDLKIQKPQLSGKGNKRLRVTFGITNTGRRTGADVAQLYLGYPFSQTVPEPPEQLRAFSRLVCLPGERKHVHLSVPVRALSYRGAARRSWRPLPGTYRVMVGDSSGSLPLQAGYGQVDEIEPVTVLRAPMKFEPKALRRILNAAATLFGQGGII